MSSLHLLDDGPELLWHGRNRHTLELHLAVLRLARDDVERRAFVRLVGEIVAKVTPATLLAIDRAARDRLRDGEEVPEIQRQARGPI